MFSSIVSASKSWVVYLVLGLICLIIISIIVIKKYNEKSDEENKKAWEENVKRNKILQEQMEEQMEEQQKLAFTNQLDEHLESIFNIRISNVVKLCRSNKCTNVVENFFQSTMANRFCDLDLYVVPKSFFKDDNNSNISSNFTVLLKYIQLLKFVAEKSEENERVIVNETDSCEKASDEIKSDIYVYLSFTFSRNIDISSDNAVFIEEMEKHDLRNMANGIESVNSLFIGLNGLGVINNFSLEDWYTFVGFKQDEINTNRFFELCNKFEIDFEEIGDEISDVFSQLFELNKNDYYNYFISHQSNVLFRIIHNVLDKKGADDLAEFLLLIVRHYSDLNYSTCIDFSKSLLDIFDKIEKSKTRTSNLIYGVKKSGSISVIDIDEMNGVQFEEFVAKMFVKLRYEVRVTKASGDQGVDIIAKKDGKILGIQAKRYSGIVGNHAIMEVVAGANYYGCNSCMVVTNSTFSASAKELAQANNVELWDRKDLIEQIELLDM